MKTKNIIALLSLVAVVFVSCDRSVEFQHETFATFSNNSYSVEETVGQVTIPVEIYNPTGAEVQVSVAIQAGNAVEGTDYEVVSPSAGILTFSGEQNKADVVLNIISHEGTFTGAKTFAVQIQSLTEGLSVGSFNLASVTIVDIDHPLAKYIGKWSSTLTSAFNGSAQSTTINIVADPDDETYTKLFVDGGMAPYVTGATGAKPQFEAVQTETGFKILAGQPVGYNDVTLYGFDAAFEYFGYDIEFALDADGNLCALNGFGSHSAAAGGFYEAYLPAVFTKAK